MQSRLAHSLLVDGSRPLVEENHLPAGCVCRQSLLGPARFWVFSSLWLCSCSLSQVVVSSARLQPSGPSSTQLGLQISRLSAALALCRSIGALSWEWPCHVRCLASNLSRGRGYASEPLECNGRSPLAEKHARIAFTLEVGRLFANTRTTVFHLKLLERRLESSPKPSCGVFMTVDDPDIPWHPQFFRAVISFADRSSNIQRGFRQLWRNDGVDLTSVTSGHDRHLSSRGIFLERQLAHHPPPVYLPTALEEIRCGYSPAVCFERRR